MGASYGGISVKGIARGDLVNWLKAQSVAALVGPEYEGWITFSDQATDAMELKWTRKLLGDLTREWPSVAFAVAMYDEEDLRCFVAVKGRVVADYWMCPGMMMENPADEDMLPRIDDAEAFVTTLGLSIGPDELSERLLVGSSEYAYAFDIHDILTELAGSPRYAVGFGYRSARAGEWDSRNGDLIET